MEKLPSWSSSRKNVSLTSATYPQPSGQAKATLLLEPQAVERGQRSMRKQRFKKKLPPRCCALRYPAIRKLRHCRTQGFPTRPHLTQIVSEFRQTLQGMSLLPQGQQVAHARVSQPFSFQRSNNTKTVWSAQVVPNMLISQLGQAEERADELDPFVLAFTDPGVSESMISLKPAEDSN